MRKRKLAARPFMEPSAILELDNELLDGKLLPPFLDLSLGPAHRLGLVDKDVVVDVMGIQKVLPQRLHGGLHLDGLTQIDLSAPRLAGFKFVRDHESWSYGNVTTLPTGVLCDAAAQLMAYYVAVTSTFGPATLQLVGIDGLRVRRLVQPGERLDLVAQGTLITSTQVTFHVTGSVQGETVFTGVFLGEPQALPVVASTS